MTRESKSSRINITLFDEISFINLFFFNSFLLSYLFVSYLFAHFEYITYRSLQHEWLSRQFIITNAVNETHSISKQSTWTIFDQVEWFISERSQYILWSFNIHQGQGKTTSNFERCSNDRVDQSQDKWSKCEEELDEKVTRRFEVFEVEHEATGSQRRSENETFKAKTFWWAKIRQV
jgi:hypothetical protein